MTEGTCKTWAGMCMGCARLFAHLDDTETDANQDRQELPNFLWVQAGAELVFHGRWRASVNPAKFIVAHKAQELRECQAQALLLGPPLTLSARPAATPTMPLNPRLVSIWWEQDKTHYPAKRA